MDKLYTKILMRSAGAGAIGGVTVEAASGIEIALWDLAGRILDTPVVNLLGGRFRDRVRFYRTLQLPPQHVEDPTAWRDLVQQAREFLSKSDGHINSPATYILRLSSGAYYVGATTNLVQRMADHAAGAGGKTTRDVRPESLLFAEFHSSFSSARKREAQIKRWSRSKKEALALRKMM